MKTQQPASRTKVRSIRKRTASTATTASKDMLVHTHKAGQSSLEFGKRGTPVHHLSFDEKVNVIENGVTKERLLELKDKYGLSLEALAKTLGITHRTIQTKAMNFRFTGNVAEKILALSELYSYGLEIFEQSENFRTWLKRPIPVLNNRRPVDLLATQLGIQEVKQELARIDYGIF